LLTSPHARLAAVDALYDAFHSTGLQYGPGFRRLVQGWGGATGAAARLRHRPTHEDVHVHPADLDGALGVGGLVGDGLGSGETRLPFAGDLALLHSAPGELWAVRFAPPPPPPSGLSDR
jgi:hypothetical protein